MNFDDHGHIFPYEVIDIGLNDLEELLIFSHSRASIFKDLKQLIFSLRKEGISSFDVWIDGSFASTKLNPNDMDLVCFIDDRLYDENLAKLIWLRDHFSLLDIYFVKSYPEDHPKYFLTNFDQLDWLHFFTRDRNNNRKGILKLTVNNETLRSTAD